MCAQVAVRRGGRPLGHDVDLRGGEAATRDAPRLEPVARQRRASRAPPAAARAAGRGPRPPRAACRPRPRSRSRSRRCGSRRSQDAPLLQAHVAARAEHEVVEHLDAHERAGRGQPPREREVLGRGLGVARGVVVEEDERGRARDDRLLEDLARVDEARGQAADRDDGLAPQPVPRVEGEQAEGLDRARASSAAAGSARPRPGTGGTGAAGRRRRRAARRARGPPGRGRPWPAPGRGPARARAGSARPARAGPAPSRSSGQVERGGPRAPVPRSAARSSRLERAPAPRARGARAAARRAAGPCTAQLTALRSPTAETPDVNGPAARRPSHAYGPARRGERAPGGPTPHNGTP